MISNNQRYPSSALTPASKIVLARKLGIAHTISEYFINCVINKSTDCSINENEIYSCIFTDKNRIDTVFVG